MKEVDLFSSLAAVLSRSSWENSIILTDVSVKQLLQEAVDGLRISGSRCMYLFWLSVGGDEPAEDLFFFGFQIIFIHQYSGPEQNRQHFKDQRHTIYIIIRLSELNVAVRH